MKKLSILALLITFNISMTNPPYIKGHSMFSIRSQSTNGALKIAGTHLYQDLYKKKSMHGFLTVAPVYSHSMRSEQIARSIFGAQTFSISGSQIINRGPDDLMADYFGLSQTYQGTVNFVPHIVTAQTVFDFYCGYDAVVPGLYSRVYAPFVWTRWNIKINETTEQSGITNPFGAGYMDQGPVIPPIASFRNALSGKVTFGQMQEPLAFGKIDCPLSKVGFSDVQLTLGYNIYRSWRGHAGCNVFVGVPTGTRPNAEYLFEPQIGNGKHWEVGAGFSGHATLWEKDHKYTLGFYGDVNISTLLSTRQQRSFDIKTNRNLSRYMLVKEFDSNREYTGKLTPLINKTTLECSVRAALQFDIVAMLSYTNGSVVCDLGYNGWIRTQERISLDQCFDNNTVGLKGIQNVVILPNTLSDVTQSKATIYGNEFILPADQSIVADEFSPVLLTTPDLDISSAESPRLITHKIFASAGYSWSHREHIKPGLHLGGEIEFEGINYDKTFQEYRHTLSLWSLWLKGNIAF